MKLAHRLDLPLLLSFAVAGALGACGSDPETSATQGTLASSTSTSSGGKGGEGGAGGNLFHTGGGGDGGSAGTTSTSSGTTSQPGDLCESPTPTDPTTIWAKKAGAANVQSADGVATDAQGNVFVGGSFQGTIDLGAGELTSTGLTDAYVAKLSSAGTIAWSKRYGSSGHHQYAQHVAADPQGNVLVTGHFRGTIDFGGGALSDISNFFEDIFIAKLDGAGNHVWSKRYGDINNEESQSIATDAQGNIYVAGGFQKTVNFGGGALVAEDGGFNAFVVKLSPAGDQVWAKSYGDTVAEQRALGITADKDGNVYVVGSFQGSIDLGGGALTAEAGKQQAYVAKLSPTGAYLWAKAYGTDAAAAIDVQVDANGNVYALGNFKGIITLGGSEFSAGNAENVFLVKLDKDGKHVWSHDFGTTNSAESATSLALDGDKPVIVGNFTGSIDFGGGNLVSAGIYDMFLAKLDAAGCHIHSTAYGDAAFQRVESLAIDAQGNNVFVGSFDGDVDFGAGPLAANESDACIVKTKP